MLVNAGNSVAMDVAVTVCVPFILVMLSLLAATACV